MRSRIVGTARAHFLPLGFARFTMDDLAAELGMSKKTLYAQFRSKDELIDAVIEQKSTDFFTGFEAVFASPELSFSQRMAHLIRHGVTQAREISVVFLRDLRRFAPASYARLEAVRARRIPAVWERLLAEGIAAGAVRPEINPKVTAQLVLIAMQALLHPENLERLGLQPFEILGRFFNLIFAGLVTPAGREDYEKHRALFSTWLAEK